MKNLDCANDCFFFKKNWRWPWREEVLSSLLTLLLHFVSHVDKLPFCCNASSPLGLHFSNSPYSCERHCGQAWGNSVHCSDCQAMVECQSGRPALKLVREIWPGSSRKCFERMQGIFPNHVCRPSECVSGVRAHHVGHDSSNSYKSHWIFSKYVTFELCRWHHQIA